MVLFLVLGCLVVLYIIKLNANAEVIANNCKTDSDAVNIKNAQKVFYKTRVSIILLILFIVSLLLCLLCNFTNIDYIIMDYISADLLSEQDFNLYFYLIPLYTIVIREIIVQVKIGDFLYKYFKVEEPELEGGVGELMRGILYKKKPVKDVKARLEEANNDQNENNEDEKK